MKSNTSFYLLGLSACLALVACNDGHKHSTKTQESASVFSDKKDTVKEACFDAKENSILIYNIESDKEILFNIHQHDGDDVFYPVADTKIKEHSGEIIIEDTNTYCLMWTTLTKKTTVSYNYQLK